MHQGTSVAGHESEVTGRRLQTRREEGGGGVRTSGGVVGEHEHRSLQQLHRVHPHDASPWGCQAPKIKAEVARQ